MAIINISSRRELFVDDYLIHSTTARLVLQKPQKQEVCFRFDAPFDGTGNTFPVLINTGEEFRMYYMASQLTSSDGSKELSGEFPSYCCCITSRDGVAWARPSIGAIEFDGNRDNNIVFTKSKLDNFIPFLDSNPNCGSDAKFKALEGGWGQLSAYKSSDGYKWSRMFDKPLSITGKFDSNNVAFWDSYRERYWAYVRSFHDVPGEDYNAGVRDINVCESSDFQNWSEAVQLDFEGSADIPLYVSNATPYYRAPHIFMGFPMRYVEKRDWSPAFDQLSDQAHRRNRMLHDRRYGLAVTDSVFMTSRDGKKWRRTSEAFLRPGLVADNNWVYGDCLFCIGMQETRSDTRGAPNDLSMYCLENHWKDFAELRRYTLRIDGFMALSAGGCGHETVTKPFIFDGSRMEINVSTSARGFMKVEMQEISGERIDGFDFEACDEIFGDRLSYTVTWNGSSNVAALSGKPIRMRLFMEDADLFSIQFSA